MTEQALRSVNNIPPRGVVIKAGSSLLVARANHLETDVALHLADNGQLSLANLAAPKRPAAKGRKPVAKGKTKARAPVAQSKAVAKRAPPVKR
jgi:hypothetical protein